MATQIDQLHAPLTFGELPDLVRTLKALARQLGHIASCSRRLRATLSDAGLDLNRAPEPGVPRHPPDAVDADLGWRGPGVRTLLDELIAQSPRDAAAGRVGLVVVY